jgi:hypothetical protein
MSDQSSPVGSPVIVRIQQNVATAEGDSQIIGLNVIIEHLDINIVVSPKQEEGEQIIVNKSVETMDEKLRLQLRDPSQITALLGTWLKGLLGDNIKIVVEAPDE